MKVNHFKEIPAKPVEMEGAHACTVRWLLGHADGTPTFAMREFEKELAAFGREKPITRVELDQAKAAIVRSLPEEFETVASAAGAVAWNWAYGLPLNESDAFAAQIAALTLDQVNAIARKYARNDQSFFVLIGDRAKIETQLKDSLSHS